jgi:hypothetical protein
MTDTLLYAFSKEQCESFVESLEQAEASSSKPPAYNYSNTQKNRKTGEVTYFEIVDARSRLCAMDNKERIEQLSERITALEEALS